MAIVLLKNKTRELMVLNVGDKSVRVERAQPAVTASGTVGTRVKVARVSSSVTLMPGECKRVPAIILKQRAVQRGIAKGHLKVVQQKTEGEPPPQPALKVEASAPIDTSSSVVEEGVEPKASKPSKAKRSKKESDR